MKKIAVLVLLIMSILASSINVNASSTGITGPDDIHKQSNHILTIGDILSLYQSSLGQIQVIDDQYTGYGNILGIKTITLYATDGINHATKNVNIHVVQSLGNVTAVSDYKNIHVRKNQPLTPQSIVQVLEKTGHLEITSTTQMMVLSNTYTGNEDNIGQYIFEFRLINSAGVDQVYTSYIHVSDTGSLFIPDIIFEAPPSPLQQIWTIIQFLLYLGIFAVIIIFVVKNLPKNKKRGISI